MCVTANEYIGELTECNEGELYWIDKAVEADTSHMGR